MEYQWRIYAIRSHGSYCIRFRFGVKETLTAQLYATGFKECRERMRLQDVISVGHRRE